VATYDDIVGEAGLPAGGSWAMERMARGVVVEGAEGVPGEGPLLVVSNHPGLADAVALFAAMPRGDLKVIAAERPFLSALPNTSRALIPVPTLPTGGRRRSGPRPATSAPAGRSSPSPAAG
jgi:hypothetical protein